MKRFLICIAFVALAACGSTGTKNVGNLPTGQAAYAIIPSTLGAAAISDYHIGPLDSVDVAVFQEPELSVKAVQVDLDSRKATVNFDDAKTNITALIHATTEAGYPSSVWEVKK